MESPITVNVLIGIIGVLVGILIAYLPRLSRRLMTLTGDVAGHGRDIKTAFRDIGDNRERIEVGEKNQREILRVIEKVVNQSNLLIQRVTAGGQ